jgi:hypothetical protein
VSAPGNGREAIKVVSVLSLAGAVATQAPELSGCAEHGLGLWDDLQANTHEYVSLPDKEKELDEHLLSTDVLITTPFGRPMSPKKGKGGTIRVQPTILECLTHTSGCL